MHFHRFCDQNKTQLNRLSSYPNESELAVGTMLMSRTKIKSYYILTVYYLTHRETKLWERDPLLAIPWGSLL